MKKEVIVFKDPKSPISEIFRTLRTNIQFMDTKRNAKTVLVTSTFAGEGKSWISSNLAVSFAQTGRKVLLIDADMRKGRQYTIFGIAPKPGLSNYLSGITMNDTGFASKDIGDYIQTTDVENLHVMAAGNVPPNPAELLIAPQMTNLIEEAKQIYDILIIDSTPSQLVADSLILARIVDSTIVVTACKETKKEDLKRVITNIQNVGGKISGVVLNKVPVSAKKYEERYYYSSNSKDSARAKKLDMPSFTSNEKKEDNFDIPEKKNVQPEEQDNNSQEQAVTPSTETNPTKNDSPLDKTHDILKKINEYLEQEKKNLK